MILENLVKPERVLANVSARSKKHCIEILSELLTRSNPDIAAEDVFSRLIERERLGCTCLDKGIAFPHCRVDGITESTAALLKLAEPVDFDSTDGEPVDLVFGMLVPAESDEGVQSQIQDVARLLKDGSLCKAMRGATSSSELGAILFAHTNAAEPGIQAAGRG